MSSNQQPLLFDKFEIIETLKKDDHSAVYRAMHIFLGVEIILKTLDTSNLPDPAILERFKREAKILAKLKHPNIINVLDFGTFANFFYISFEYFESKNLREWIKAPDVSIEERKNLLIQLLLGVQAAHQMMVIHRDIKPENILVNSRHELKIADFGLAFAEADSMVTQKASIVGTPTYMSPEQICAEQLTQQSDLFSLGIVGYEMFIGINPFVKADISATINSILNFDDTIYQPLEQLPADIATAIKGLLQKQKAKRFTDCSTALNALGYVPGKIHLPVRPSVKKQNRFIYLSGAVLFVMLLAAGIRFFGGPSIAKVDAPAKTDTTLTGTKNPDTMLTYAAKQTPVPESKTEKDPIDPKNSDGRKNAAEPEQPKTLLKNETYNIHLAVDCSPWATVYVDSQKIDVTPVSQTMALLSGTHSIRLVHPEYPVYSTNIRVTGEANYNYKINLDTLAGKVIFNVFPWADVFIDGSAAGQTPFKKPVVLAPGKHQVRLRNPSFAEYSEQIVVKKGETSVFKYAFEKGKNQ